MFRALAFAAAALVLVVIVASAIVRHGQVDVRCVEWPACAVARAPAGSGSNAARITHRLAATLAAFAVLAMVVVARSPRTRRAALAALALVIALAAFGVTTGDSLSPRVALGNLVGGYALFAVLLAAAAFAAPGTPVPPSARTAAAAALLFVFAEAAQIALVGNTLPLLPFLHRGVAAGTAVLVLAAAWWLRGQGMLAALLVAALAVVAATGFAEPTLALAVTHNASAAALAGLLAYVVARGSPPPSGSDSR